MNQLYHNLISNYLMNVFKTSVMYQEPFNCSFKC